MQSIGVRELRQHASRYLKDVQEHGQTIEVTDRGRPVARLVPVPQTNAVDRLRADGRLSDAKTDLLTLGRPLPLRPNVPPPSEALAAARADER